MNYNTDNAAKQQAQSIYNSFLHILNGNRELSYKCSIECAKRLIETAHTTMKPYLEQVKVEINKLK